MWRWTILALLLGLKPTPAPVTYDCVPKPRGFAAVEIIQGTPPNSIGGTVWRTEAECRHFLETIR
jgi:hypothetical protein